MTTTRVLRSAFAAALVLTLVSARDVQAQGRIRFRLQSSIDPLDIVGSEVVQQDLGLKPQQVEKVDALLTQFHAETQKARVELGIDFDALRRAPAAEQSKQMAKLREARQKLADKFNLKLASILDQAQQARMHEIGIQIAGAGAFQNPAIIKELGLTSEQQQALAAINENFEPRAQAILNMHRGRPVVREQTQKRIAMMNKLRDKQAVEATAVLTKDQQQQFAKMKGKPFDTSFGSAAPAN